MFLDANGDSANTADDRLNAVGVPTVIHIWLDSAHNRDGSTTLCPSGQLVTVSSFEVILHAAGGTVTWNHFDNLKLSLQTTLAKHR
jgi:hypothetical protein